MVKIAGKFDPPHRERYLNAAKAFRLPYLDYFRARDGRGVIVRRAGIDEWRQYDFRLPDVLNEPGIKVKLPPLDTMQEILNPLYSYKFKEGGQMPQADWDAVSQALPRHDSKHPLTCHALAVGRNIHN
jgi:hypothetical protein